MMKFLVLLGLSGLMTFVLGKFIISMGNNFFSAILVYR